MFKLEGSTRTFVTKEPAEINLLGGYNRARVHYDFLDRPIAVKLIRISDDVDEISSYLEQNPREVRRIVDYIESHMSKYRKSYV